MRLSFISSLPPSYHWNSSRRHLVLAVETITDFNRTNEVDKPLAPIRNLETEAPENAYGTRRPGSGGLSLKCDVSHITIEADPIAPNEVVLKVEGMKKDISSHSNLPLLSVSQVCDYLAITRSTFYKWRARGVGPQTIRLLNGDLRVSVEALSVFVLSLTEKSFR